MPLVSSGEISIGGSTTNRSINLELGRAAGANSSLNETALRSLAGISSGTISLSNFYGKSSFTHTYFIRTYGNYGNGTELAAVARDSSTNVYLAGSAGSESAGAYIVKADANGTVQWQRSLGAYTVTWGNGVGYDGSGNVYVAGQGGSDVLLVKYNSSGTLQWQRTLSGPYNDLAFKLAVSSAGNVYFSGTTEAAGANSNILTAKYDTNGNLQWQRTLSSASSESLWDATIDSSENVYICGAGYGLSPGTAFIAKYNSSGTLQWQRNFGSGNGWYFFSVAADASGNLYASSNVDTIVKYDTNGNLQWQRSLSGCNFGAIAVDSSGNSYTAALSEVTEGSTLYYVLVFAKIDTSGTLQWQRYLRDNQPYYITASWLAADMSVDSSSNMYCVALSYDSNYSSQGLFIKLRGDGSVTGTYGIYTYAVANKTYSTPSATNATATLTDAAGTLTSAASSYADAARTISPTVTTL
jgi:hypothetical protein